MKILWIHYVLRKNLGATIEDNGEVITITPPAELTEPDDVLDCGNAGTGMRLYAGLLAGIEGSFVLTGDKYLRARPMKRVANPLRTIGAKNWMVEKMGIKPLYILEVENLNLLNTTHL